jgi:hypothetical protein
MVEYPNVGSPMHCHVVFGSTFTSDPRFSIISPILKSPMLAFSLNSLLVLLLVCRWLTVFSSGFCFVSLLHFSRMFCNTLMNEGSLKTLTHDCKNSLIVLTCPLVAFCWYGLVMAASHIPELLCFVAQTTLCPSSRILVGLL